MTFKISNTPILNGKIALVTGGNIGLGYETVKAIASRGAHVVLVSRSESKGKAAIDAIRNENPSASVDLLQMDLATIASIKAGVQEFQKNHKYLDILVNNAGIMAMPERKTEDGFESQFGVNHLGHWVLTALLMPSLMAAPEARVVTVTSSAHHMKWNINFKDPHMRKRYSAWGAYGQSKLANYYFALGLHEEFVKRGLNMKSLLAHPGIAHTNLQVESHKQGGAGILGPFFEKSTAKSGMSAADGALPQIRAALDPAAKSREFYAPRYLMKGVPVKRPFLRPGYRKVVEKLWQLSENETGVKISF